jgi:hypothetical protein
MATPMIPEIIPEQFSHGVDTIPTLDPSVTLPLRRAPKETLRGLLERETQRLHHQPDDGLWLLGQTGRKAEPEYTDSSVVSGSPLDERHCAYWE